MNLRLLFTGILTAVCLATLASALIQRQQLAGLRAEQQGLITRLGTPQDASSPAGEVTSNTAVSHLIAAPSLELLKLRSEVARLTGRRRELAAAQGENDRLRIQFAASHTNVSAANALPPGYVRKSEARFVGYNTPADTIQSLLWAVQNRDLTNLLAAFTPETARQMQQDKDYFENVSIIPGMHIKSQQQMPDGSIELEVEMVPGEPLPDRMRFRQFNGQWKLEDL
ncbi:MAG TPA: hypothetical protein VFR76_10365 [Verrucomicrobiae bacterium]|nr:hypothetical protein [Verrucomicrobiae bacterium]